MAGEVCDRCRHVMCQGCLEMVEDLVVRVDQLERDLQIARRQAAVWERLAKRRYGKLMAEVTWKWLEGGELDG